MSYLALARKWRPRTFADVVGQPHVVRALSNALGSGRIHHAFLFAGTRGVGKTTVARIFARCLNCERGVGAEPCGVCKACVAVDEGRFVDLIEVDAASNTGVDDTRELLENVQYTPAAGRYKVYLIDEVHMLSKQAFNALLKTLEEPPPHVKFLFATTDPQKLPVTVLSRCLQFNLKRLSNALIIQRMQHICDAEGIRVEAGALARVARAAAGSMRDALSLLDQAVAYGNEVLREKDVAEMLGTLDRSRVVTLLADLAGGDPATLIARVRELDELVPDYLALLDDIATCLQQVAVIQLAGVASLDDSDLLPALEDLAARLDPDLVQLLYQIAITGRRDIGWAPEPRTGFEMTLLRMLAFRPDGAPAGARQEPETRPEARRETKIRPSVPVAAAPVPAKPAAPVVSTPPAPRPGTRPEQPGEWPAFVATLGLEGAARQLALHTGLLSSSPTEIRLSVEQANAHLLTEQLKARLVTAVSTRLGAGLRVVFDLDASLPDTAARREERREQEAVRKARESIEKDPEVREFVDLFGAEVVAGSVRPSGDSDDGP